MKKLAHKKAPAPPIRKPAPAESKLGNFLMIYANPGDRKTTLAAQAPKPLFIVTRDEMGIRILQQNGIVDSSIPVEPLDALWQDDSIPSGKPHPGFLRLLELLDAIIDGTKYQDRETIVLDTTSGLQALIQQHCVSMDYEGDSSSGSEFYSYQKGFEVMTTRYWQGEVMPRWLRIIEMGKNVILLAHATMVNVPNPAGPDFQEFRPQLQYSKNSTCVLGVVSKAVHAILFLTSLKEFEKVDPTKKRSRTIVGSLTHIIGVCSDNWFLAKNTYGLREHILQGDSPEETWKNLTQYIKF